ncbi:hypothetical protein ADUPG1_002288, partial [Aduncisulcus paluster]
IWAGTGSQSTLEANFVKHSDTNFALDISSQDSECSLSIDAFTANKVCSSTTPTSTHWYVVCASDSFATYTSSSSFSCSRAFANGSGAVNCLGGCAYGQECREVDAVSNQGECKDVVPAPSLHACVSTMILSDDKVSGTSTTFSVASLKAIPQDTGNTIELACEDSNV